MYMRVYMHFCAYAEREYLNSSHSKTYFERMFKKKAEIHISCIIQFFVSLTLIETTKKNCYI
jgi:hypothetical protein